METRNIMQNNEQDQEEGKTLNKRVYTYLGIIMAVLMIFAMVVIAFESVVYSPSYYISLRDEDRLDLADINTDEYLRFCNSLIGYISKGDKTALENTFGFGENERPMFTQMEKDYLKNIRGVVLLFSILRWVALAGSAVILLYVLLTSQRQGLIQLGKTLFASTLLIILALITCLLFANQNINAVMNGANNLFAKGVVLPENLTLTILLPSSLFGEFIVNWAKMSGVFSLIPLFLAIALTRVSVAKTDERDDYLYQ